MLFFDADPPLAARAKKVPLRSEIADSDKWDLTRLYTCNDSWDQDLTKYAESFPKYADFRGTLSSSAQKLCDCLEFDKKLDLLLEKLGHYCSLQTAEDSSEDSYLSRESRFHHVMIQAAEVASFLTPEIQAIDDDTFEAFLKDPSLLPWKNKLTRLRRFRPHILTEKEERLMALATMPLHGHSETFSQLTNVDMQFGFIKNEQGEEIELSHGAFSSCLVKREPELRKKAFHQYYKEFNDHKYTLAATLSSSIKADVFEARARSYPSALEAALFSDRIPKDVYTNLINTVKKNLDPLFQYYELRRSKLGIKELHAYDTYVPIVDSIEIKTTFDEAIEKVLVSLNPLGEDYTNALEKGFHDRWCDRYETKGKRSGAFSSSSYGNPPYILMNFKEDVFADVYTLTHEAGHSMHSYYSQKEQTFQDYQYPIFLAEVASTFNEELLTYHLLEITDDPKMRAYIINRQIDDIRGTLYRQTMFAEFEMIVHEMEEQGEPITLDSMRAAYRKLLETHHGPNLVLDDVLDLECLRIPHFYSAFYVYKYATGISAAVALSNRVLRGSESELNDYLGFLKSGGSEYPLETLAKAGVDMTKPTPIEAALKLFAERVKELEELIG
ncbi:MAG: oligoendopeptidase F [Verrucomicrobiota bacterium]